MVPKTGSQGNKYRPIRIECAICRLFGATASDIARKVVGPGLQPVQTGSGLRCGVEFAARMADLAYRTEACDYGKYVHYVLFKATQG